MGVPRGVRNGQGDYGKRALVRLKFCRHSLHVDTGGPGGHATGHEITESAPQARLKFIDYTLLREIFDLELGVL